MPQDHPHSSHWGAFTATTDGENIGIAPHPEDQDPSPLLQNREAAADRKSVV